VRAPLHVNFKPPGSPNIPDLREVRRGYLLRGVLTSADFKGSVETAVGRPGGGSGVPRHGETVLLGVTAGGTWAQMRIQRRYRWTASLIVRAFVIQKDIVRLAIVVPDGGRDESPRRFRVAFAARESVDGEPDISDRRLARLAESARRQWSSGPQPVPKPIPKVFGRPWPVVVLLVVPVLELAFAPLRFRQVLSDPDTWLPVIPALPAITLYLAYVALVVATALMLWRQSSLGYRLAVGLSAVQVVQALVLYLPLLPSNRLATVAFYLALSWSRPILIWLGLLLLYMERVRSEGI
jgi:hypothetical protein